MKMLIATLCLLSAATIARAEGETAAAPKTAPNGVPVETVKVTDQDAAGLFERVRDAHIRAEKKGLLAAVTPGTAR